MSDWSNLETRDELFALFESGGSDAIKAAGDEMRNVFDVVAAIPVEDPNEEQIALLACVQAFADPDNWNRTTGRFWSGKARAIQYVRSIRC